MAGGTGRRCAHTGCRAWAMRGADYCVAHRPTDETEPGGQRQRAERFAALVRAGDYSELIEAAVQEVIAAAGARRSLENEIGALRLQLQRLIATELLDGDPRQNTQQMTRLVDSIARALRTQQTIATTLDTELQAVIDRAFIVRGWKDAP